MKEVEKFKNSSRKLEFESNNLRIAKENLQKDYIEKQQDYEMVVEERDKLLR